MHKDFIDFIKHQNEIHSELKFPDLRKLAERKSEFTSKINKQYSTRLLAFAESFFSNIRCSTGEIDIPDYGRLKKHLQKKEVGEVPKGHEDYLNTQSHINNLKLFLSQEYKVPNDPWEISQQIYTIELYYHSHSYMQNKSIYVETKIDSAMIQLSWAAGFAMMGYAHKEKDYDRVASGKVKSAKGKAKRKQKVLEIYSTLGNRANLSKNSIAQLIVGQLSKLSIDTLKFYGFKKVPHRDTVKTFLREDGLFD